MSHSASTIVFKITQIPKSFQIEIMSRLVFGPKQAIARREEEDREKLANQLAGYLRIFHKGKERKKKRKDRKKIGKIEREEK